MKPIAAIAVLLVTLCTGCRYTLEPEACFPSPYPGYDSLQDGQDRGQEQDRKGEESEESERGFLHVALLYLPNRLFDILDLVRFRVRVGPGLSLSARATKPLSAYVGAHSGVYVGFPGPRGAPTLPLPVGFEAQAGAQVSAVDATKGTHYGATEVGVGAQLFLLGFDVGVDPLVELFDLVGGILTFDPASDDL